MVGAGEISHHARVIAWFPGHCRWQSRTSEHLALEIGGKFLVVAGAVQVLAAVEYGTRSVVEAVVAVELNLVGIFLVL